MTGKRGAVLRRLQRGAWVKQWTLMRAGGMRYGARLYELRRLGWRIETKCLGGGEFVYRMRGKA